MCYPYTDFRRFNFNFNQIFELLVYFYLKTLIYAFSFVRLYTQVAMIEWLWLEQTFVFHVTHRNKLLKENI